MFWKHLVSFIILWYFFEELKAQQGNIIHTITTLSQARCCLAATSSNELVFFAGGYNSKGASDRVDIYNVTSGSWTTATLSIPRGELAATSSQNLVFFGGGSNGATRSNQMDIYNTLNGSWSTATLSQPRSALAATSVGNLVLFGGGYNSSGYSNVVDVFNVTSNTWTTATLSQARTNLAATSVDNRYALFGGGLGSTASNVVDIFDSLSGMWNTTTLSQARQNLAATSLGNLAFFGGGQVGNQAYQVVDIFNSTSQTWNTTTLSQARYGLAASSFGEIVAFGGGHNGLSYSSVVDMLNVTSNTWFTVTLSQSRYLLASTSSSNRIFFGGGKDSNTIYIRVDVFCFDSNCPFSSPSPTPVSPPSPLPVTSPLSSPLPSSSFLPQSDPSSLPQPSTSQSTPPTSPFPFNDPLSQSPFADQTSSYPTPQYSLQSPSPVLSNDSNSSDVSNLQNGLPSEAIFGIIFGIVALLISVGVVLFLKFFLKRRKRTAKNRIESGVRGDIHSLGPSGQESNTPHYSAIAVKRRSQQEVNSGTEIEMQPKTRLQESTKYQISFHDIEVERQLGGGSYGKVYLGRWNNAPVALKFCKKQTQINEFLKEAQLMIDLPPHPNIVQMYGVSIDGPQPVIVMEYCSGGSLEQLLLNSSQSLSEAEKVEIVKGIARGMLHLHNHKIIHRDLAARNILLSETRVPKISDFGMSRVLERESEEGQTKAKVGPIRWMAPESISSKKYSQKSDVWSFGIVVWEIVTQALPYSEMDLMDVIIEIRDHALTPKIPENCPPLLRDLMLLCWKQQPDDRPVSLRNMTQTNRFFIVKEYHISDMNSFFSLMWFI